jgi:hypothetical protein
LINALPIWTIENLLGEVIDRLLGLLNESLDKTVYTQRPAANPALSYGALTNWKEPAASVSPPATRRCQTSTVALGALHERASRGAENLPTVPPVGRVATVGAPTNYPELQRTESAAARIATAASKIKKKGSQF